MKVTIERTALLKALGHVHRIVERRNTIPILSNVLIEARDAPGDAQEHRPRPRSDRVGARRRRPGRRDDRARARHLRHRAQIAGRRAGQPGNDRRGGATAAALGALALLPAEPAGVRFSRPHRRRIHPSLRPRRRRSQAADRQHPVRDFDRGDALLSQRHLLPHGRRRRDATCCARSPPTAIASRGSRSRRRRARPACPASSRRARRSAKCRSCSRT